MAPVDRAMAHLARVQDLILVPATRAKILTEFQVLCDSIELLEAKLERAERALQRAGIQVEGRGRGAVVAPNLEAGTGHGPPNGELDRTVHDAAMAG